jgi:hypothetical protein
MAQLEEQRLCHDRFIRVVYVNKLIPDSAPGSELQEIKTKYRREKVETPAPLAVSTIFAVRSVPPAAQAMICEQQLAAILRYGILIVAIHHEKLASGVPPADIDKEVQKSVNLTGLADFDMILGVAHLYDKDLGIASSDSGSRRAAVRQMSSY